MNDSFRAGRTKCSALLNLSNWQRLASNCWPVSGRKPIFKGFSRGARFALVCQIMRNPILIRKSMALLKEMTQILREIIASGDEERFRQLQDIIHALNDSRQDVGSRALH